MPISGYLICIAIPFCALTVRPALKGMMANVFANRGARRNDNDDHFNRRHREQPGVPLSGRVCSTFLRFTSSLPYHERQK